MHKYKFNKFFILLLITFLILTGCRPSPRPEGERQAVEKPPIPEGISQGEGQEPRVNVYLVETGEIKEMAFEEYLNGVLAGEMRNNFPLEALKAQAILARTFVMEFVTEKGQSKYEGAHVSTDIQEAQAWNAEEINDLIKQAVQETRGQVAVYDGKYVKAWFHAHAGWQTATAKEGIEHEGEEPPYIQVVESPDSPEAPEEDSNWTATFTKAEVVEAVRNAGQEPGDFNDIEILETGPSGRATRLRIGNAEVSAPSFRLALDSTKLKSMKLESVNVEGDQVTFKGVGYGHGVGMSQWGAFQMAQDGRSAEEIVKHYFKDIEIVKLWE
ncbi:SpoIID/LytB domain-containing protein [Serpentinicella alkaliphila]|uniref:Stage II sporulation protein D n=1 Tax=Serpentinicella alkaliphila TaxID=1734049 RepID=A0A4R2TCU8_9FIRM|nr:SpoIID/LytB domain-containing protein [Serpentinicella alkaliphila]QUH25073.1 SpoIID/LytB domain-containing protein [Serpentinicella alkaliphila]TCP94928.1 stage II sporulation protein D [Serpentinicella alkaliphila]